MRPEVRGQKSGRSSRHSPLATRHSLRTGVTLTEVLMSVLLTGFGVVTLATLFPISVMRTIQATQVTQATALRYNAEATIDMFPLSDGPPALLYDPDNLDTDGDGDPLPTSRSSEHVGSIYVVDPLGANLVTASPATFGNGGAATLPRFHGGLTTVASARRFVTSPDSFDGSLRVEGTPTSSTATSATLPTDVSLANIPFTATIPSRITIFDATGRRSVLRTISNIAGQTVSWTTPLPAGFSIVRVRIEIPEDNYSWMLTVRNLPGAGAATANANVVVFFKRTFAMEDEHVHAANLIQGSTAVPVAWTTTDKPHIVKGGWLFDIVNAHWYRIQNVTGETSSSAQLTIDRPALASSTQAVFMRGVIEVYPIGTK